MTYNRVLRLEGVHNFRDFGGYAAAGGGRVRRGLLWRSAQHVGASDAELEAIDALALTTVVDLRGNSERLAAPCRRGPGFAAEVILFDGETAGLGNHVDAAAGVIDEAGAKGAMRRLYSEIAFRPNLIDLLRRYFAALAEREGPSLVHCLAGKDRTGLAVALVHHALGVHRDDIVEDYLLTRTAGNIEQRIAAGAAPIRARYGNVADGAVRALMSVEPEYLETAIAAIEARYGSLDAYLGEMLVVDDGLRANLRERYVEA